MKWMDALQFDANGLMPVVVQQFDTGEVLMLAWMNREAIETTIKTGKAHYYSRSRKKLWMKGETSKQTQEVKEILLDCDGDALLLKVNQHGVACHTGRRQCFFISTTDGKASRETMPVSVDPKQLYDKETS